METTNKYWTHNLVGHFVGPPVVMGQLEPIVEFLWGVVPRVRFIDDDLMLFEFGEGGGGERALEGSPWPLEGSLLLLKPWEPLIRPSSFEITEVPTWANILDLPVDFWTFPLLAKLMKPIGQLISMERSQEDRSELRWLRVLVMKSLFAPVITEITVDVEGEEMAVGILYDGNPRICIQCGDFGHHHGDCLDEPGTGRAWSRYVQANLPYDLTTNRRLQQWRNERESHRGTRNQGQQQGGDQRETQEGRAAEVGEATGDRRMANLQVMRVQAPLNPNINTNDADIAELWEGIVGNVDMDLALSQTQPLMPIEEQRLEQSPTVYSSASDASIIGVQGVGGTAWRMYLPEDSDNNYLEELMRETMNMDIATLTPQEIGMMESEEFHNSYEGKEQQRSLTIEGLPGGSMQVDKQLLVGSGDEAARSEYKALALAALEIDHTGGGGQGESNFNRTTMVAAKEGGGQGKMLPQGEFLAEIDRVMMRVEEAMSGLEEGGGSKRMRRSVETSATEVRNIVKQLEEGEARDVVQGATVEDGKVVLMIASDSSGESGERKRKRRNAGAAKAGSVASRLRKKAVVRKGKGEEGGESAKKARMVVRKVKVSAKKPSTSLTLAPPTLGWPNE